MCSASPVSIGPGQVCLDTPDAGALHVHPGDDGPWIGRDKHTARRILSYDLVPGHHQPDDRAPEDGRAALDQIPKLVVEQSDTGTHAIRPELQTDLHGIR